jgi:hypothetical protein
MDGRAAKGIAFAMPVSIAGWMAIFAAINGLSHLIADRF